MPSGLDHPNSRSRSAVSLDFLIRLYIGIAYACNNLLAPFYLSLHPLFSTPLLPLLLYVYLTLFSLIHTLGLSYSFYVLPFPPQPISVFSSRVIIRCIASAFCVSYLLVIAIVTLYHFIYSFLAPWCISSVIKIYQRCISNRSWQ